jgi:hypothetical protein
VKWFERIMKPLIAVFRRIWIELVNTVMWASSWSRILIISEGFAFGLIQDVRNEDMVGWNSDKVGRLGKVERTMQGSVPFQNCRHFPATITRSEELFEPWSEILWRVPSRRAGHALSKLSIIDVSISKTFDKMAISEKTCFLIVSRTYARSDGFIISNWIQRFLTVERKREMGLLESDLWTYPLAVPRGYFSRDLSIFWQILQPAHFRRNSRQTILNVHSVTLSES